MHSARKIIFALITGLGSSIISFAAPLTIDRALHCALENDPTVMKVYGDVIQADGVTCEVRSDLRPQVSISTDTGYGLRERTIDGLTTGGGYIFGNQASLVVEQLVWDNGFSCHKVRDAKLRAESAKLMIWAQKESTAFSTIDAFLRVIKDRRQVEVALENQTVHEKFYQLAVERHSGGIGDFSDVELAKSRWKLAEVLVKEYQFDLEASEADYKRFTGYIPGDLRYPVIPRIKSITEIDPKENYRYQAIILETKAAQMASKAVCRSHSPKVFFRGTGGSGEDTAGIVGENEELSALLVMDWDLVKGGERKGQKVQSKGEINYLTEMAAETETLLRRDITGSWSDYCSLRRQIPINRLYRNSLKETVTLYQKQFQIGERPLLDILDTEREIFMSQIQHADNQYEMDLNAYQLLYFGGKLVTTVLDEEQLKREPCLDGIEYTCINSNGEPEACATPAKAPSYSKKHRKANLGQSLSQLLKKDHNRPKASTRSSSKPALTLPVKKKKSSFTLAGFFKKRSGSEFEK